MATITQYVCANEPRGKDGLEGFVKGGVYDVCKKGFDHYDLYGNPPEHPRGAYIGSTGEKALKRYFRPHTEKLAPADIMRILHQATQDARQRAGDDSIGTQVKKGLVQVVRVTFPPEMNGRSIVKPLTDYVSAHDAVQFIEALGTAKDSDDSPSPGA